MKKLRADIPDSENVRVEFFGFGDKPPAYLEIEFEPGSSCLLLPYNEDDENMGDTWYLTLEEAKLRAFQFYGVETGAWVEVEDAQEEE